jgi:sugar-specific transcriptional regulator TrmB
MQYKHQVELQRLGLSQIEAQIYLTLLRKGGTWKAAAIAASMQVARSTAYEAINSLKDRGLLEGDTGYGSRLTAVPVGRALPGLIAAEREELVEREHELSQREHLVDDLVKELETITASAASDDADHKMVEVLRDPRSVLDRFEHLQLEAQSSIDAFTKPPYFDRGGNKAEQDALRRGVRTRAIYEKAGIEDPAIKPFFHKWITAGEEARIHDGELPHKMVIFDRKVVLMPLFTPGEEMRGVLIRNAQLAENLSLAFQFIWEKSKPVVVEAEPGSSSTSSTSSSVVRRNGHSQLRLRKAPNA